MSKFEIDQKVLVVEDNELKPGTIRNLYETLGIAIVDFGGAEYKKVKIDNIAIEHDTEKNTKSDEPIEREEITITPNEFMEIATSVLAKEAEGMDQPIMFMGGCSILMGKIHKALFVEDPNDDKTV